MKISQTYMGVPKKMSESHWGTYFIWPFRCSGFFGGSRISSKMVSLHLPVGGSGHLASVQTGPAGCRRQAKRVDVSSGSLTGDCLEGQQLDVFPTRVGWAVVLGQSTAVFLVGALHLLHRLGLWRGEEAGWEEGRWRWEWSWRSSQRIPVTQPTGWNMTALSDWRAKLLQEIQPLSSC